MRYVVITFYKYVRIEDTIDEMNKLRSFCKQNNLFGRILMSTEGINGGVSGKRESVESFKKYICANELFSDITFREQQTENVVYHKLVVRIRKEVVDFRQPVRLAHGGQHLSPEKMKQWLDRKEDVVLLDARNKYETKIGKFKNAITLPIETFRDFPQAIKNIEHLKSKKIVMYCTGGIRCEKSSAFLREQGFEEVYQLEGGIINFTSQFPNTYFEGSCFVFDDRIVADVGSKEPLNECSFCKEKCDDCINCHNLDCDRLFVICSACQIKTRGACSEDCKNAPRQRTEKTRQRKMRGE